MRLHELTESDHELIRAALNALEQNFDDGVYHHTVGAAVRTSSGKVYAGVNMGGGVHGSCAEYTVLGMALSQASANSTPLSRFTNTRRTASFLPAATAVRCSSNIARTYPSF